jgi:4'-phosphopantetheinyl transferase
MGPADSIADSSSTATGSVRCQVWIAELASHRDEYRALLDEVELERLRRYPMVADRHRFTVAAALLRTVAGRHLQVPPAELSIDRACPQCDRQHGKPRIRGVRDLHVSVSHSADLIAVALTRAAPIGVDLELVADRDYLGLARTFLASQETVDGPDSFYALWTRKEAIVKATGDGLRMPLPEVVVTGAGEPAGVISYGHAPLSCCMADLRPRAGYIGAVAVLTSGMLEVEIHPAEEVLAIELA